MYAIRSYYGSARLARPKTSPIRFSFLIPIIKAIEEGRTVYDNIKKFITYILTSNIPEILPFIAYVLLPVITSYSIHYTKLYDHRL